MTFFIYQCRDIADRQQAAATRKRHLQDHLDYVEANLCHYAVAGPNRHADGDYHSSTFILRTESAAIADGVMAGDPYVLAGLYEDVTVLEFIPAAGEWVGGISWA